MSLAETYTTNTAITALKKKAFSGKDRIIIETGTFKTCNDAFDEFLSIEEKTFPP